MLVSLHVKNLVLIREIEVEFTKGLNILTGETGAGKSILLGSVQLALGGKMSRDMIREDADYALVELLFQVEDEGILEQLAALDIYPEEGGILLSRRVMEGRSICRINGETCTMSTMKKAASYLLDIHGQHEHQSLLYCDKQLEILDAYGKNKIYPLKEDVSRLYRAYTGIKKQLSSNAIDEEKRKREISFLEFEINEISEAALLPDEDIQLEQEYRRLNNSKQIMEALQQTHICTGYDGPGSAGELIGQAIRHLSSASQYDTGLEGMEETLGDIDGLLNDFNRELSSYMDGLVFEEEDFRQLEERLNKINNLKAKFGQTISAVHQYQQRQQKRLEEMEHYEENRRALLKQLEEIEKDLQNAVEKLTAMRRDYAHTLEQEIIEGLRDLNFQEVKFQIQFEKTQNYTVDGRDQIEYQISTNPGEPLKPLSKVVSGGELSRIMLAIKTILADKDQVETLIFDEVDTGISGRTAQKVSEKMALIGRRRQVLCITHLPQIASMADRHFEITKTIDHDKTITEIKELSQEESVKELARLLGGAEITNIVMESAREMKVLAQKQKNTRLHS